MPPPADGRKTNVLAEGDYLGAGVDAVPEPASIVLLGSGLLGLAARRRVKRAKA